MSKSSLVVSCISICICLGAEPVVAVRNPASSARKVSIELVQGTNVCTSPNTTAPGSLATPACDPVQPSDPVCTFGPRGRGRVTIRANSSPDLMLNMKLSGLSPACTDATLCLTVSFRASHDYCGSSGDCSAREQLDFPLFFSCCTVNASGRCADNTTVNTEFPGLISAGNRTELIIGEVGIRRSGATATAFRGGLLVR